MFNLQLPRHIPTLPGSCHDHLQPSGRANYKLTNCGALMVDNPVWEIRERVAEVQALLDDHVAGGKYDV